MMKRRAAFTLIELLVVIGILGVLVTILVPIVSGQIEEARRKACAANLRAIGQKMMEYAAENNLRFPTAPSVMDTGGTTQWAGKTDGTYRMLAPDDTMHTSVTASQWLLVRGGYVPVEAFICPSTNDTVDDFTDMAAVKRTVAELYDFKSRNHISYSFFMPYGRTVLSLTSESGVGVGADKSPFFDNATGTLVGGITPASYSSTNSSNNHNRDGQNVLFNEGRVVWSEYANAGVNGDHVYTRYLLPYVAGGEYDPQIGAVGNDYTIEEDDDTFFGP